MSEPWPEQAGPGEGQVYRCRHCPKDIMLRAGYWTDADGFPYCQKRTYGPDGRLRDPILHEPMPVIPGTVNS